VSQALQRCGADNCGELAHELARHGRLLHVLKTQLSAPLPSGLDGAAFAVLMALAKGGPRRQGELAEATLLDPSTVSRYAAQLVRAGLVERRPDPADGRAVHLVATAQGTAFATEAVERRQSLIADLIKDWSQQDADTLVRLLRRLNDGMECRRDGAEPVGRTGT